MPNEYRLISDVETKEISIVPWGSVNRSFIIVKGTEKVNNPFWMGDNMVDGKNIGKEGIDKEGIGKEGIGKESIEKENIMKSQLEAIQKENEKLKIDKEEKIKLEKEMSELKSSLEIAKEAAQKAEEIAKAEKNIRLESEKIAFAKESLSQLGSAIELGKLLKEASEVMKKESYEYLLTIMKSAEEKIKAGSLYKELGSDTNKSAKADLGIDTLAKEIMAKEHISYDVAVDRVITQHPEMLDAYYNIE